MDNVKLKLSIKCALFIMVSVLIDQITKAIAICHAVNPVKVLDILNFSLTYNGGISFGLLSKYNLGVILVVTTIILIAPVCYIMFSATNPSEKIAYSFFIGGAIGNLIDRCKYGCVVDFIDIHIRSWHFPTFNVADMLLSLSCIMLVLRAFKK